MLIKHKYIFFGCIANILLNLTVFSLFFYFIGDWLVIDNAPEKADVVHVLGGDSCDFHRTKHAISLYRSGVSDTLVFSSSGQTLQDVLEASESIDFPREKRIAIDSCLSTIDEARAVKKLNRSWKSIILVTDIYHTRRAVHTFQKILPGVKIYSSSAFNSTYNEKYWWKTETGFLAVIEETVKSMYYFANYGVNPF